MTESRMTQSELRACLNRLIENQGLDMPKVGEESFLYATVVSVALKLWIKGVSGDEDAEALRRHVEAFGVEG